jgi:nucleoid-associated protein YgaU
MSHRRGRLQNLARTLIWLMFVQASVAWTSPAAADSGAPPLLAISIPEPLDQLQAQVDELRQRIQGMEGKLKESANARKAADQARMEAERRMAEGRQEVERLRTHLDELQAVSDRLEEIVRARESEIARLDEELVLTKKASAELAARIETLQDRLPESEGGKLTADQIRQSASEALVALKAARAADTAQDEQKNAEVTRAEIELQRRQFRLANVTDAQSIYRVHANDSLAMLSDRFYGNSREWERLFEANRHVLENPDRLTPGMTLIVP